MASKPMPPTGNTTLTAPENRVFYPALDGLRAIAFLMVLGQHYASLPWGWTGVNLFFVLSGFLITGILWDTRDRPHRARNFYIRRTLRIFPLYYGIALLFLLTTPLFHWRWSPLWLAWPLYLGNFLRFLGPSARQGGTTLELAADAHLDSSRFPHSEVYFGHFWSLCVEEQFYLIWPWIIFSSLSRRALLWLCAVVVVISPFLRVLVNQHVPHWMSALELTYRFTPLQLDSLLLGAMLALLWRGQHREILLRLSAWAAPIAVALALVYIGFGIHGLHSFAAYPYPDWKQTWGLTLVNFLGAALILCCLQPAHPISRFLSLKPLRWIGRISYGAYVFHDLLHGAYLHLVQHSHIHLLEAHIGIFTTIVALIATLIIASLSFRFFESPFLNMKDRLTAN